MLKTVLTAVIASACLMGCANQRFNIAGDVATSSPKTEDSQTFWVDGIGQNTTVDAAQTCGGANKVAGVAVEQTGGDVLLGIVTLGIYTPRTARVYCK
jgi:Bor protein